TSEVAVARIAARANAVAGAIEGAVDRRQARGLEVHAHSASLGDLVRVADRPEARHVRDRVRLEPAQHVCGLVLHGPLPTDGPRAWPSRDAAASSAGASPTSRFSASAGTNPASSCSSRAAEYFAAQPPQEARSVSFTLPVSRSTGGLPEIGFGNCRDRADFRP